MIKKFISLLLAMCLVSVSFVTSFAADAPALDKSKPYLELDNVCVKRDEMAEVAMDIGNNPGVWGMSIDVAYDSNILQYQGCLVDDTIVEAVGAELTVSCFEGVIYILIEAPDINKNITDNGVLLYICFDVKSDVPLGKSELLFVNYSSDNIFNTSLNDLPFTYGNGAVTVVNDHNYGDWIEDAENGIYWRECSSCGRIDTKPIEEKFMLGDVNDDGKINGKDVLQLRKYIVGLTKDITEDAADVTADGKINGKDVLQLRKYIVGLVKEL